MQRKNTRTYYIGLCATYHDPALALLDEAGNVLFAEATERFLQYKRALDAPPTTFICSRNCCVGIAPMPVPL